MAQKESVPAAREIGSAVLFCTFVVIGCAYIIAAKFASVPAILVTSVPIGIMLLYAATLMLPACRLRLDQGGDNLYYMGFLLTLTSLGVSLYQFTANGAAQTIVQNFGIAIGSTIAGVWLRVLFSQMRRDPLDIEQASRIELSEAARRVRRELDAATLEFAHFRRASQQTIVEGLEEVSRSLEQASERILKNFEKTTATAAKSIDASSAASSEALAALSRSMIERLGTSATHISEQNTRLADETGKIASALEVLQARLRDMLTPDRVIEIKLEPFTSALANTMEEFGRRIDARGEAEQQLVATINEALLGQKSAMSSIERLAHGYERQLRWSAEFGAKTEGQIDELKRLIEPLTRPVPHIGEAPGQSWRVAEAGSPTPGDREIDEVRARLPNEDAVSP